MSLHAADGSFNVTFVNGTQYTGLYAANGSYNAVEVDGTTYTGVYNPCGAFNIFLSTKPGTTAPCGALNCSKNPYTPNTLRITDVTPTP